ncbi:MAG: tyrosine-type recombinase/integrase [Candidatus Eremiobacterota bacterium]
MIWSELTAAWLEHLAVTGRARATCKTYAPWLQRFVDFCHARGVHRPGQLTEEHLARWLEKLRRGTGERGWRYRPATVNLAARCVRGMLRWAVSRGHLFVDPSRGLVLPQPVTRSRWLTEEDTERLLAAPHPRTPTGLRGRALLETLYGVGLRSQECLSLDLEDLDLAERLLTVRRGKGGRSRRLPVGDSMAAALEGYLRRARPHLVRPRPWESALFVSRRGTRLSLASLEAMLCRYSREAGLQERVSPHMLRHSCATHMLAHGADLRHVQELLGHVCSRSTQRYTHLLPLDLQREHRRTHPRSRRPR